MSTQSMFLKYKKLIKSKSFFNPIFVFVTMQGVWLALTTIWVFWFSEQTREIVELTKNFTFTSSESNYSLIFLIVGCILLSLFAVGTSFLFAFGQRQSKLIRQQKNFVSSVTHELRSPLSSLQLTLETMKKRTLDKDMTEQMVNMALDDIARLSRLVSQILVSARLDRGLAGFEDAKVELKLSTIIAKALEQSLWLDQGLYDRILVHCDEALTIRSAKSAITLIISNLIENAIKYSPKGTPIIITVDTEQNQVIFSIRDDGIGLNSADIRRIFRMFYRSAIAARQAVPGTGLGLFIVKSLTQVLGGKVWVESIGRGHGSTFYVALPKITS